MSTWGQPVHPPRITITTTLTSYNGDPGKDPALARAPWLDLLDRYAQPTLERLQASLEEALLALVERRGSSLAARRDINDLLEAVTARLASHECPTPDLTDLDAVKEWLG